MKRVENVTDHLLVLPGGREIAPGKTAKLDADTAKNGAVVLWIKRGDLKIV